MSARSICTLLLVMTGCKIENDVGKLTNNNQESPALVVEPPSINFGIVQPLESETGIVTLRNEGDSAVDILSVNLEGVAFTAVSTAPIGLLQGGESVEFMLSYTPQFVEDSGWLTIESSDPELETARVELLGQGAYPLLVLDPPGLDMGWTTPGGTLEDGFIFRNEGLADLTVHQTLLVGAEFVAPVEPALPMVLAPEEEYWFDVHYQPIDLGRDEAAL